MKKYTVRIMIALGLCLSLALGAAFVCLAKTGTNEDVDIAEMTRPEEDGGFMAKITAIDSETLTYVKAEMPEGMGEGGPMQGHGGTRESLAEGETPPERPKGETPPELPSGESAESGKKGGPGGPGQEMKLSDGESLPEPPKGETPPELPSGESAESGRKGGPGGLGQGESRADGETPPALPDGETPPARPEGDGPQGEAETGDGAGGLAPVGMGGMKMEISFSDETLSAVITQDTKVTAAGGQSASLSELSEGSIVRLVLDGSDIVSIEIMDR